MIQRIQNLYLGISAIIVVLVFVLNFQYFADSSVQVSNSDILFIGNIFLIVILILNLGTIFFFKTLGIQKLCLNLSLFITILFIFFLFGSIFFIVGEKSRIEPKIIVNYFYFIVPISLITLNFLALKGVKKDINLLSSADRLR